MTEEKGLQLKFWTGFKDQVLQNNWNLKVENITPQPRYYYDIRFGYTGIHLSLHLKQPQLVLTGLYIESGHRESYRQLYRNRKEIETILGPIQWIGSTSKNISRLTQSVSIDWQDEATWPLAYNWLAIKSYNFQEVVKQYLE